MDSISKTLVYMLVPVPDDKEFSGTVIGFDTMKMLVTVKADSENGSGEERTFYLEPYDDKDGDPLKMAEQIDVVEGMDIAMPYKIDALDHKKVIVTGKRVKVLEPSTMVLSET